MEILVENFQSIEKAELKPSGFTIIMGDSNIGKSSVVRAITGALLNALDPTAIRKGKKGAFVRIKHDGHVMEADRTEATTIFVVDGARFAKLNRKPCPAIESLGFRAVAIADTQLTPQWIDDQFNPLFLVNKPPSVAAGMVTQATRLDVISTASKAAASELRQKRGILRTREADKTNLEQRRTYYYGVKALTGQTSAFKQTVGELTTKEAHLATLKSLQQNLAKAQQRGKILADRALISVPAEPMDLSPRIQQLKTLQSSFVNCHALSKLFKLLLKVEVPELPDVDSASRRWQVLLSIQSQLKASLAESGHIAEERVLLEAEEIQVDQAEEKLHSELGVCPLCEKSF